MNNKVSKKAKATAAGREVAARFFAIKFIFYVKDVDGKRHEIDKFSFTRDWLHDGTNTIGQICGKLFTQVNLSAISAAKNYAGTHYFPKKVKGQDAPEITGRKIRLSDVLVDTVILYRTEDGTTKEETVNRISQQRFNFGYGARIDIGAIRFVESFIWPLIEEETTKKSMDAAALYDSRGFIQVEAVRKGKDGKEKTVTVNKRAGIFSPIKPSEILRLTADGSTVSKLN